MITWTQVWTVLNSNLVILLLGSGVGFLFLKLVWEPYKERQADRERRTSFREETFFRLVNLGTKIGRTYTEFDIDGADPVRCLDPSRARWSLHGLIFAGWGASVLEECHPLIEAMRLRGKETDTLETIEHAKQSFRQLQERLHATRSRGRR